MPLMPLFDSRTLDVRTENNSLSWREMGLLLLVGLFSFFYNLDISLFEGTEGLYGQVTRELVRSGQYVHLTFQGQQYLNKPPMFFWMTGGWTRLLGDNEVALRFTGSLFSLGTMALTFVLGRTLFSWQVGFWAALIFATNHVFIWYGRRVLIDSTLTFFVTLALLGWVLAKRPQASSGWYAVTFLSIALAGLVKGLHGFALPLLLIIIFSIWLMDFQALTRWGFWIGVALFVIIVQVFASMWGPSFQYHFGLGSLFHHISEWSSLGGVVTSIKFPPYLYLLWFDFFPWSVLIPSSFLVLFRMRPFKSHPEVLLILLWFLGYLLVLCLSKYTREPYLMPLAPAFALAIGHYLVSLNASQKIPPWHRIVNAAAFGILTVAIIGAFLFGPLLLQKKWNVPADLFPGWYMMGVVLLGGFLVWTALQGRFLMMRQGLAGMALCFVFGILQLFLPAMDAAGSPRVVNETVRVVASRISTPLYHFGLTQEDLIYYLNADPSVPRLHTVDELVEQAKTQNILIVTDLQDAQNLINSGGFIIKTLEEFPQPRGRKFFLLAITGLSHQP